MRVEHVMRTVTRPFVGSPILGACGAFLAVGVLAACATAQQDGAARSAMQLDAGPATSAAAMRAHMGFLASDLLRGRDPGTPGYDIAAGYVASQFALVGAKPAGGAGSYLQPVPLVRYGGTGNPRLSVRRPGGKRVELVEGEDFGFRGWPGHPRITLSAPLAFAGYGIVAPELGRDDFAGVNLAGKVVMVLEGLPSGLPESAAGYAAAALKREEAGKRGAVGVIFVVSLQQDARSPVPAPAGATAIKSATRPASPPLRTLTMTWRLPGGEVKYPPGNVAPVARVDRSGAAKLLAGAPVTIEQIEAARRVPGGRMPALALPGIIQADLRTQVADVPSANVAAMIQGYDPALRDEVVVLSAHLDHLGIQPAVNGDTIANGALDNASGVATLLEVARMFHEAGTRPRRSVLLLAVTAEEQGLLGSEYFVNYPTVAKSALVANVNLDMPILTYAFQDVVVLGAERSTIGPAAERAAARLGIRVTPATPASQSLFGRSDQLNFAKEGVPAIFLRTGSANGGAAASDAFDSTCYHAVCDDLSLPLDYTAAARFARLNYEIARELTDAPERPRWTPGDVFARPSASP